jgi:hypothetical protein
MLRLDDPTLEQLEDLSTHFDKPAAEIIRHLIAQATPEDFPRSWHMRAAERRVPQTRPSRMSHTHEKTPLNEKGTREF